MTTRLPLLRLLAAPAALALAGGLAWIGSAAATDTPLGGTVDLQPQLAQAAPPAAPPTVTPPATGGSPAPQTGPMGPGAMGPGAMGPGAMGQGMGGPGMMGHGPMGAMMGQGPMGGMAMPAFSPKDMCAEQVARRIGNRAYLKARLDLKPEQMSLWNNFEKAANEASAKDKARCATLPAEVKTPPTYMERMTMREDMMKARLASLEAVKPSLQALYAALTPEQKAIFDKPMRMGMGMGGMHRPHHNRG